MVPHSSAPNPPTVDCHQLVAFRPPGFLVEVSLWEATWCRWDVVQVEASGWQIRVIPWSPQPRARGSEGSISLLDHDTLGLSLRCPLCSPEGTGRGS